MPCSASRIWITKGLLEFFIELFPVLGNLLTTSILLDFHLCPGTSSASFHIGKSQDNFVMIILNFMPLSMKVEKELAEKGICFTRRTIKGVWRCHLEASGMGCRACGLGDRNGGSEG